jgi:hypothetical protein
MCSFDGRILPRSGDRQLRYVGRVTRTVSFPHAAASFAALVAALAPRLRPRSSRRGRPGRRSSTSCPRTPSTRSSPSLKYQLPASHLWTASPTPPCHTADTLAATSPKPPSQTAPGGSLPFFQILECRLPGFVVEGLDTGQYFRG